MDELTDMQALYDSLVKKAKEDGKITNEEQAILDQVKMNVIDYEKLLEEALDDGVITEAEATQLRDSRAKILEEAWVAADTDALINSDEAGLLNLLLDLLKKIDKGK